MNTLRRWIVLRLLILTAVAITALAGWALAEEPKVKPASKENQRASGVIVKVDKATAPDHVVLTINTAAVWRDWARDQANANPRQSPRKDAREGNESVATKGEPRDRNTLVKVEVARDSQIETRFRAPNDQTNKGIPGSEASGAKNDGTRQAAKPPQFRMADLNPGLFIEADFRRNNDRNVARCVAVIRPLSVTGTSQKRAK
jgi:hypothetical protein